MRSAVLSCAVFVSCVVLVSAQAGRHVMGVVSAREGSRLDVRTDEGSTVKVEMDERTRVRRGSVTLDAAAVAMGARVMIDAEERGGRLVARDVQIMSEAPAGGAHTGHPGHEAHAPSGPPSPAPGHEAMPAGHTGHGMSPDMSLMAGMTADDPMAGMIMPLWHLMDMGVIRFGYDHQGGPSGADAVESTNWNMAMAQRDVAGGRLTLMLMNSLEPATLPEAGSPHLFQTGESLHGRPLVDRQHPHDLFMNLSATWRRAAGARGAFWVQAAPVGEPALGPTAFMHRASAGENPSSPLGHHWQDSTHIASTVLTAGAGWGRIDVEASAFHGAEPDEHRWNFDGGAPDSFSGRVRLRLPARWSAQVSHGFLKNPEALVPGNTHRTTASLHYGAAADGSLAATLLWGRNREDHGTSDALLAEGAWQWRPHDQLYARAERVEKPLALLATKEEPPADGGQEILAAIRSLTVGYFRGFELYRPWDVRAGLGADLSVFGFPEALRAAYGDSPLGLHVFLRVRWGKPHGAGHEGHGMAH